MEGDGHASRDRDAAIVQATLLCPHAQVVPALNAFLSSHQLPETSWGIRWAAGLGDEASKSEIYARTPIGLGATFEVAIPAGHLFARPVKVEMLREIDAWLRALDPRVVQVSASLAASMQEVEILRPEGGRLAEARPMVRLNVSVIVEENGRRESGSYGGGGRHGLAPLMGTAHWQDVAREALRIAVVNLRAEPAPAGRTPR